MDLNSAPSNDVLPVDDSEPVVPESESDNNVANAAPETAPAEATPVAEPVEPVAAEPVVAEAVAEPAVPESEPADTEEPAASSEEEPVAAEAPADEPPAEEAPASKFKRGDMVEGVVTSTSPTEILIQLDDELEGIISGRELARMDRHSLDELEVGRSVLVYVLNPLNRSGQAVLSLTRALEERDWRMAQDYASSQDLYTGKVSGYNKGGLIVRFGRVRGFVPASQVSEERRQSAVGGSPLERWGAMIGEDIVVKVVEVDRNRNRLILSERAATKEVRDQRKAELLDHLEVGSVRQGRVVSLTDFGAFVDLGGADGLIHLTELSWKHVTRPDEVVKVGQEVTVKVISLDRDRRRIGLSMKSQGSDPWESVVSQFQVGQLVKGTITKLTKFGAFACLEQAPQIEGLIHISELADHRVGHPREVVNENEELTLRIVKIDRAQRRMGLSLKQVDAIDYLEIDLATYGDEEPPVLESIPTLPVEDEAAAESSPEVAADDAAPADAAEASEPEAR